MCATSSPSARPGDSSFVSPFRQPRPLHAPDLYQAAAKQNRSRKLKRSRRLLRLCHGGSLPRGGADRLYWLVHMALGVIDLDARWGLLADSVVVDRRFADRKARGHSNFRISLTENQGQTNMGQIETSNGSEGIPLATTNSDASPSSISSGMATLVVITAAPVATPMDGIVLPASTLLWLKVRQ